MDIEDDPEYRRVCFQLEAERFETLKWRVLAITQVCIIVGILFTLWWHGR